MNQNISTNQVSDLVKHLQNTNFFKQVDVAILKQLAANSECVSFAKDESVFQQGDPGNNGMYIIIEGSVCITLTQQDNTPIKVGEQHVGQIVGEMGMLTGSKRTANVEALSKTTLIRISKATFDKLVQENPEILSQIGDIILQRLHRNQLISILTNLLDETDLSVIETVESELSWLQLPRGQILMRQGEIDNNLYLLVSGRLHAVVTDEAGNEQVVGDIARGESVGEMQIFTGEPRSVSVYAARDSVLVGLSKESFDRLSIKHPKFTREITRLIINRLRRTIQDVPATQLNLSLDIALVPASPDVPIAEFAQHLVSTLEKLGSVLFLNTNTFDSYLGKEGTCQIKEDDPDNIRLVAWLNEQEPLYKFLVYQTDYSPTPWTKRCLRQADKVLIVTNANSDPNSKGAQVNLVQMMHEQQGFWQALVLLHPENTQQPKNTHVWLNNYAVDKHYHVRWGDDAHFRRLARLITGRAVGLVLGGGGSRGFAHMGIMRAAEELGVEIDLVGGTSFGSLAGALYALEWDYNKMYQTAKQLTNTKLIFDYTIPFTSFLAGKKFNNLLKKLFDKANIEDTWRPFYCVSTDFKNVKEVIHHQGPLWHAIRASSALPLAFPPVIENDTVLMDGGVINNVPVDIMRHLNSNGAVISVDISVHDGLSDNYKPATSSSGWKILWNRLNPFANNNPYPPLSAILMRWWVMTNIRRRISQEGMADLCIHPPIAKYDIMNFEPYEEIIEVGYQAGLKQIGAWLKSNG